MKTIIFATIVTLGLISNASELSCRAHISDIQSGLEINEVIKLAPTNASAFRAEAGEIVIGNLKFVVYKNLAIDSTTLSITKKTDSTTTPYVALATSGASKLQPGQELYTAVAVGSKFSDINCFVK